MAALIIPAVRNSNVTKIIFLSKICICISYTSYGWNPRITEDRGGHVKPWPIATFPPGEEGPVTLSYFARISTRSK
jgi:hypothetical protein